MCDDQKEKGSNNKSSEKKLNATKSIAIRMEPEKLIM